MEARSDGDWRGTSAFATRAFFRGDIVSSISGEKVPDKGVHTIQINADSHFAVTCVSRYLAHSCEPNAVIVFSASGEPSAVVALHDIAEGDMVTFDYATSEWDMAEPFRCACGAPTCRGLVKGAIALTVEQRAALVHKSPFIERRSAGALATETR